MEAIFASFLLLTSLLLSIYVFHSGLRAEAGNEKRVLAAALAEEKLTEIRQAANENFGGLLAAYQDKSWPANETPGYQVSCRADWASLGLNCLELESQYPATDTFPKPERRLLKNSAVNVDITVAWNDPLPRSVTITERVVSMRETGAFEVRILDSSDSVPGPISLPKGDTVEFHAQATVNGQRVSDLQYTWYVQPVEGFGSLTSISRDGQQCQFRNAYRNFRNWLRYAPGVCFLVVTATYQGRTARAKVRIDNEK